MQILIIMSLLLSTSTMVLAAEDDDGLNEDRFKVASCSDRAAFECSEYHLRANELANGKAECNTSWKIDESCSHRNRIAGCARINLTGPATTTWFYTGHKLATAKDIDTKCLSLGEGHYFVANFTAPLSPEFGSAFSCAYEATDICIDHFDFAPSNLLALKKDCRELKGKWREGIACSTVNRWGGCKLQNNQPQTIVFWYYKSHKSMTSTAKLRKQCKAPSLFIP